MHERSWHKESFCEICGEAVPMMLPSVRLGVYAETDSSNCTKLIAALVLMLCEYSQYSVSSMLF